MNFKALRLNNNKIINLKNVSTVILDVTAKPKIIYNFVNSINIMGRETPDYTYEFFNTAEEAEERYLELLKEEYICRNFIYHNNHHFEVLNMNFITSISYDEIKERMIFNLNYSVSVKDRKTGNDVKISKFVYWNGIEYDDYKKIITKL